MFLGREVMRPGLLGKLGFIDKQAMRVAEPRRVQEPRRRASRTPRRRWRRMSGGQRQGIAVSRAVTWASKVVFMDEPTAALGVVQTRNVLDLIGRVRDQGLAVVLISHNMPEVFEVADRIEVLRLGTRVARFRRGEVSMEDVVGGHDRRDHARRGGGMTDVTTSCRPTSPRSRPRRPSRESPFWQRLVSGLEHVDRPDPRRADRRLQPARAQLVPRQSTTSATSPPTPRCCSSWPPG